MQDSEWEISKHLHFRDYENKLAMNSLQYGQWGRSVRMKGPQKEHPVRDTFVLSPFNSHMIHFSCYLPSSNMIDRPLQMTDRGK